MQHFLKKLYRFLPVQLLLLHLRKYQLLLLFWFIIIASITDNFASHFGASSLFLAPEYLGAISFWSMLLLGGAMAAFVMAWNITTFIIHSHRIPFLGATRQSFLNYCLNNALLPVGFLIFYSFMSVRFQWYQEHAGVGKILLLQLGFYLGFALLLLVSFFYFFRVGRDLLKVVLTRITNPSVIREIIPYDTLDAEFDMIHADTYLSENLRISRCCDLENYHPRLLRTVLRRHHRNAIAATIFALIVLILLGVLMDNPILRIPAGSGFLILFAVMMGMVGAVKYFLKTWELMGWVLLALFLSFLTSRQIFDLRSSAKGLDYNAALSEMPIYDYEHLQALFSKEKYRQDAAQETNRLNRWKTGITDTANASKKPPVIVISVSGGGSRAAYWTFRSLQYLDSLSGNQLFSHTVLLTGASGGMIGASYWRALHSAFEENRLENPYSNVYQQRIGKDLLNAIIFSFASVDLVNPFNKISLGGYRFSKDRGYAMEQEMIRNTAGALDGKITDYKAREVNGKVPQMIISGTIINDGRKLLMGAQPMAYLTQPGYALRDSFSPPIDAVDFQTFFAGHGGQNLKLSTALRMNATFPYILPVVKLPSEPQINVMDAGLRDNFGIEVASRYLFVFREWLNQNAGNIIFLQIRDTREHQVFASTPQSSLGDMLIQPLTVIQNKWEPFQSYTHSYIKEVLPELYPQLHFVTLTYIPRELKKSATLNFHLTQREKEDLYDAIYQSQNQVAVAEFLHLLENDSTAH